MKTLTGATFLALAALRSLAQVYATFYIYNNSPCPSDPYKLYKVCPGGEAPLGDVGRLNPWETRGPISQVFCPVTYQNCGDLCVPNQPVR